MPFELSILQNYWLGLLSITFKPVKPSLALLSITLTDISGVLFSAFGTPDRTYAVERELVTSYRIFSDNIHYLQGPTFRFPS